MAVALLTVAGSTYQFVKTRKTSEMESFRRDLLERIKEQDARIVAQDTKIERQDAKIVAQDTKIESLQKENLRLNEQFHEATIERQALTAKNAALESRIETLRRVYSDALMRLEAILTMGLSEEVQKAVAELKRLFGAEKIE